jgi:hypothetical protein
MTERGLGNRDESFLVIKTLDQDPDPELDSDPH